MRLRRDGTGVVEEKSKESGAFKKENHIESGIFVKDNCKDSRVFVEEKWQKS